MTTVSSPSTVILWLFQDEAAELYYSNVARRGAEAQVKKNEEKKEEPKKVLFHLPFHSLPFLPSNDETLFHQLGNLTISSIWEGINKHALWNASYSMNSIHETPI